MSTVTSNVDSVCVNITPEFHADAVTYPLRYYRQTLEDLKTFESSKSSYFLPCLIYSTYGGSKVLRNVDKQQPENMATHPRKQYSLLKFTINTVSV
jgi:hypothetical protein